MTITEYIIPTPTTPEAYVRFSADKAILTFYYDTLRAERDGTTWGIEDTREDGDSPSPWVIPGLPFSLQCLMLRSAISAQPPQIDGFTNLNPLKV